MASANQKIKPSRVKNIYKTSRYERSYKKLDKKFPEIASKLDNIIEELANFRITTQYKNHPLQGKMKGYWDLHVTGDVVLIYRYIGKSLEIDLELNDIANHDFGLSKKRSNEEFEYDDNAPLIGG